MQQLVHELQALDGAGDGRASTAARSTSRTRGRSTCASPRARGRNAADDDIADAGRRRRPTRPSCAWSPPTASSRERVRAHGAEVVGAKQFRDRLDAMRDPRYSRCPARLARLRRSAGAASRPRGPRRELGDPVAFAGTAGHVLDFDDTYLPGIAHLSAPTAPAALVVAAELGLSVGDALDAYAEGFEAMAARGAREPPGALRPRLASDRGVRRGRGRRGGRRRCWTRSRDDAGGARAAARAAGLRAAFGSDGKSLQVGLAAASGVARRAAGGGGRAGAARRAAARASQQATGGRYAEPDGRGRAAGAAPSRRTGSRPGPAACRRTARSRPPTGWPDGGTRRTACA